MSIKIFIKPINITQSTGRVLKNLLSGKRIDGVQYEVFLEGRDDRIGYLHSKSIERIIKLIGVDNMFAVDDTDKNNPVTITGEMLWSL
jgi:hypothetical protein